MAGKSKFFTPKEATEMLPLVSQIVTDVLDLGGQARALCLKLGKGAEEDPRVVRLMDELELLFVELESLGCTYKDWDFTIGVVDFPSRFGDKAVSLCWKSDEKELLFYHDAEEGFAARKPIPKEYL